MGTHNSVLRLGEAMYLEIIAVNPVAPRPSRPRWFELDRLETDSAPRLTTWIARTHDIHAAARAAPPGCPHSNTEWRATAVRCMTRAATRGEA